MATQIVNQTTINSTGCPAMDALDLAECVLDGTVTGKEIIAKLFHINGLINEERQRGEALIVPAHLEYINAARARL
jgi:hypothetical protein